MEAKVGSVMKCRGCRLTVVLCQLKPPFASAPLWMSGMSANCFDQCCFFCFVFFNLLHHVQTNNGGNQMRKQVTWLFLLLYCIFMSENAAHTDICALSWRICVLTILSLFVIKLVQTCRARPPRAVNHTTSLLTKKSLVLIISILWACLSAQNRHLNHPPQQQATKPHQGLTERTFWWTH